MGGIVAIAYVVLGLVQLAAVMAGLEEWVGLHWVLAFFLALIIAYIPLVGSVVGIMGAIEAWHWAWWQAGALFFGGLAVVVVLAVVSGAAERRGGS